MDILWIIFVILAVAAAGGLTMAVATIMGGNYRRFLGYLHGVLAASGVVLLTIVVFTRSHAMPVNSALILLGFALAGGLFNLAFRLQREPVPVFMIILHGAMALAGLAVLVMGLGT